MAEKNGKHSNAKSGKLLQNTSIKVPLYPTAKQAELCDQTFGCCRWIWNQMLCDEQEFYAATDEHFIPTPAKYKREAPFLKEVPSQALSGVHQNLKQAFERFFNQPERYRYPNIKRKKDGKDSFYLPCQYYSAGKGSDIYLTKDGIRLPKLGIVKANLYRKPLHWWKLKSVTVSKSPKGKYYASILFEYFVKKPTPICPTEENTLGLSFSMSRFYVDSEGNSPQIPHFWGQSSEKLQKMQSRLSRMEPGSNNYNQQLQKIRALYEHIANQRRDFIHKESKRIANAYSAVCVRADDLQKMSQTMKLGNVTDWGFGVFRECLSYKLRRQGKTYISVDRYAPTARICKECGYLKENISLSDRVWVCPECGSVLSRESNAAQNIKKQGLKQFAASGAA